MTKSNGAVSQRKWLSSTTKTPLRVLPSPKPVALEASRPLSVNWQSSQWERELKAIYRKERGCGYTWNLLEANILKATKSVGPGRLYFCPLLLKELYGSAHHFKTCNASLREEYSSLPHGYQTLAIGMWKEVMNAILCYHMLYKPLRGSANFR